MVERLEEQLDMLEAFARAAFTEGKDEFLPEVATKLEIAPAVVGIRLAAG